MVTEIKKMGQENGKIKWMVVLDNGEFVVLERPEDETLGVLVRKIEGLQPECHKIFRALQ